MGKTVEEIKQYYDEHTVGKLKGFVNNNERVERAWTTIIENINNPNNILEVGCGIGDLCWRMSKSWPKAHIEGIDISPKSIKYANKLFANESITYKEGVLTKDSYNIKFDLIVLIDVYEHIMKEQREELHHALKAIINNDGKIILSFPTPRHLSWLKKNDPSNIQPIDEDITIETICKLAKDINKEVLLYKEVSVWHQGDYAHAVLGSRLEWIVESDKKINNNDTRSILKLIYKNIRFRNNQQTNNLREEKLTLIKEKLGIDFNLIEEK